MGHPGLPDKVSIHTTQDKTIKYRAHLVEADVFQAYRKASTAGGHCVHIVLISTWTVASIISSNVVSISDYLTQKVEAALCPHLSITSVYSAAAMPLVPWNLMFSHFMFLLKHMCLSGRIPAWKSPKWHSPSSHLKRRNTDTGISVSSLCMV